MPAHDVAVELFYEAAWHDHAATDEVYTGDATHGDDIKITYGSGAESGGITPASATLVFRSWRFNPDNVSGDLYGLIGRNTPIRITVDGDVRFSGEVSSWTPRQSLGGSVQVPDRWVEVEAGGIMRRLEAGADPLPSSLKTFYLNAAAAPVAYWTMEHGPLSDTALPDLGAGRFIWSNARLAEAEVAPWLEPGVSIASGTSLTAEVIMSDTPAHWAVDFMRTADDDAREFRFVVVGNSEDASRWRYDFRMHFDAVTGELELIQDFVGDGAPASNTLALVTVDVFIGVPSHVRLDMDRNGTSTDWDLAIDGESVASGTMTFTILQGVSFIAPVSLPGTGPSTAFSHIAVFDDDPPALADTVEAAFGYPGEYAGDRFVRLSGESGVTDTVAGTAEDTVPMGPQFRGTLAAQFEEIQATDDGLIADTVTAAGVTYKTGRDRYNQDAALTLDYAAFEVAPPLEPVIDDKLIRNDVTASRREGGKFRAVDEVSVAALGRYTARPEVNVFSDLVLDDTAGWHLHTGTIQGTRFARVTVDLDASPGLKDTVVATGVGDRIAISNLPAELTPDAASMIALGWAETVAPDRRKITFNCVPEAALHIAELDHDDYGLVDADDGKTTVRTAFNSATGTSLEVVNNYGQFSGYWTTSASGGFDIAVAGVRLAVTAVVSDGDPNFHFTVTQGAVNGVLKTIPVGASVNVFHPSYIGL